MTETIVDGVLRAPVTGIRVIIVGGGNAGLQAALECWRKGMEVVVLERSKEISPLGDFYTIIPSALITLKHYPAMHTDYHQQIYDCSIHIFSPDGKSVKEVNPEWNREGVTHVAPDVKISFLKRRPVVAKMLHEQCARIGIPVHLGQKGVYVEETESGVLVKTESGDQFEGDICIAADGIGSKFHQDYAGGRAAVQDTGYAVARVAFPRSTIKPGSKACRMLETVDERPQFRTYLGNDLHLIIFLTTDWVAWAYTHENNDDAEESWHNLKSPDVFIRELEQKTQDWDPAVMDFIKQTPTDVVDWKLMWRDSNPEWTSSYGRVVKIGDAAHAFLPTSGNGVVQGLEDAISLAECLRIGGKQGVQWATRVHNKLRFERTSTLQRMGFVNREELHHADLAAIEKNPEVDPGFFKMGRWVWDHDAEAYARDNYATCLAHLKDGSQPFTNTNLPPGHVYQPWTLKSENERMAKGEPSGLKDNGYWGI